MHTRFLILGAALLSLAASPAPVPPPSASRVFELGALSRSLEDLVARVRPAVVQVLTTGYAPAQGGGNAQALLSRQRGSGSGVIVDAAGYIVTNAHVVQGARRIQVVLGGLPAGAPGARSILKAPGRVLGAQLVGLDRETDLAVLRVTEQGLPSLPLGDSEALRQGQVVLAFGSPFGLDDSVTLGVVSAVARQVRPEDRMIYVQTDAAINPGNSGGPLVDTEGRVVGINTLLFSQSGGSEGLGFAAPSHIVRTVFEQLRQHGRVRRGEIGVRAQTVTPLLAAGLGLSQTWGAVLADVSPGSPAARAGLSLGDLVLRLDGKAIENARQLYVNLYGRPVGDTVRLDVLRAGETRSFAVPVAERAGDTERLAALVTPEENGLPALGILGLDLDPELAASLPPLRARAGIVVAAVAPDSPAWQDPLLPGDVIYALNGQLLPSVARLREALSRLTPGSAVVLQVERAAELRYVVLELE
jgi:serine protease Do